MTIHMERPCNADNYRKGRKQAVKYLVIHYVGARGNAAANAKYYGNTKGINASAHYFVGHGPSPEVWASVAEADTAWHVGCKTGYKHAECRNENSIGVELCCHQDGVGNWYFDKETVDMAVGLCRDIVARYNIPPERVLRHYDVTGKVCPAPFVKDAEAWEDFKERVFAVSTAVDSPFATDSRDGSSVVPTGKTVPLSSAAVGDGPDEWAKLAWDKAKERGVLDGTRPHDPVTRQELAVVLNRLGVLG